MTSSEKFKGEMSLVNVLKNQTSRRCECAFNLKILLCKETGLIAVKLS